MSETAVLLKVITLSTILSGHNLHDIHNVNEFNDNVNGIYDIKECCSGLKYSSFTGKKSFVFMYLLENMPVQGISRILLINHVVTNHKQKREWLEGCWKTG